MTWIFATVAILGIVIDQLSKYMATRFLLPVGDVALWKDVFHLHYAMNTGAAFGIMPGQRWFFYAFTVIGVGVMLFLFIRNRKKTGFLFTLASALIVGGAIGNLIDRVRLGYVVDFFYFKLINFAIFNVADTCVVIGTILLAIYLVFLYDRKPEVVAEQPQQDPQKE